MLKEFAEYLVSLKTTNIFEVHGESYSDKQLMRIKPHVAHTQVLHVTGLDSIVKLVKTELPELPNVPVFVRVDGPCSVKVLSTLDAELDRDELYAASCDVPGFCSGFRSYDEAIIELRSRFRPSDDIDYLLDLLSRINKERGITTEDNGVSQTVEARTGISLKEMVSIRPRVSLRPFRTFLEVEQPESEFLLRLDNDGNVGLFEADGGIWKLSAKESILNYLCSALDGEISDGRVVVMM